MNANGRFLRSFIETRELVMVNANKQVCNGTFTHMGSHSPTLLDYTLVTKNLEDQVKWMFIDEEVQLLEGTRVAVIVEVALITEMKREVQEEPRIKLPEIIKDANAEAYGRHCPKPHNIRRQSRILRGSEGLDGI